MYDPKFEKAVQQKMEELEFSPSDAVWTNIEQAVNANKKRRRLPFFWIFFLSGALLLGAGIVYKTARPSAMEARKLTVTGADKRNKEDITPGKGVGGGSVVENTAANRTVVRNAVGMKRIIVGNAVAKKRFMALIGGTKRSWGTASRYGAITTPAGAVTTEPAAGTTETAAGTSVTGARTTAVGATISAANGSGEGSTVSRRRHNDHIQGLASFRLPPPKITGARLPVQKSSGLTSLSTPKYSWEAAFTGGIGVSSFKQTAGHQSGSPIYASPAYSYFVTSAALANNPTISKGGPSSIEAGPAFYAGVLARKPLSARWAVTIGLDLSYSSSRVHTGPIVNGYAPTTLSLINAAAAAPIQTYPYYVTGDNQVFTNRYYSLEIPATVQWQINHSRTLPLFLESGLSFSYLASSDALYYNSNSDVYFKDRDVVNRAQVNFTSSLMIGLPLGGVNLQAGPQLEYGLTSLLATSAAAGQHLFYGGLRVVIIPKGRK